MAKGYIYIRAHESYDLHGACKLGKTANIPDRDKTYVTSELIRGKFILVVEVDLEILDFLEFELQWCFDELNLDVYINGGTEFYKKEIVGMVVPYLQKKKIAHKVLTDEEINNLIRTARKSESRAKLKPRDYQFEFINRAIEYFARANKGLLIVPCGVGKTLISLWIAQKLEVAKILIGVPNRLLVKQWDEVIAKLFPHVPRLIISGEVPETILPKCVVICTYSSAHKLAARNFTFDMKILDEAHHLTTRNMELAQMAKTYVQMLNVRASRQLSLTATLKYLEDLSEGVANDNLEHFGEIIERKCLLWAIDKKIVCDYVVQIMVSGEITGEDELFFSAYAALKSIHEGHSHHLLIYLNNKENARKIAQHIKKLLDEKYFTLPNLSYSDYHSEMKSSDQKIILNTFNAAKQGIISCVYCLGEGYDNHLIDAVVFAENMSSNIRIVQSALRASRKNKHEPDKITKIILPVPNLADLRNVKEVIYQMGLEDETIGQKIKAFKIDGKKHTSGGAASLAELDEYDKELTEQIKLKTITRTALGITYENARKIIAEKHLMSKEEYLELCKIDGRLTDEPEIIYKGQFSNWIDYLSIPRIYYDIETCKNKIKEYFDLTKSYLDFADICKELCAKDKNFPPFGLWTDYYDIANLHALFTSDKKTKKSSII